MPSCVPCICLACVFLFVFASPSHSPHHPLSLVNLLVSPLSAFTACEYLVSFALFWSCAFLYFWPTIFCWTIGHLFVFVVSFFKWITLYLFPCVFVFTTLQKPVCDITEAIPIFIQWQLIMIQKVDRDYDRVTVFDSYGSQVVYVASIIHDYSTKWTRSLLLYPFYR